MVLSERQKQILFSTVQTYISTGEPVGSKILCEVMPIQVSSATIRSVLSDLCELGFLNQPHTSAGRVPTAMGYRFFIEQLLNEKVLSTDEKRDIDQMVGSFCGSTESVLEAACESLARFTGCAAMVTAPAEKSAKVKQIQLIKIGRRTVMTVVVTSNGIIKNRVAKCEMPIEDAQLENAHSVINKALIGKNLEDVSIANSQGIICNLGIDMLLLAPIVSAVIDCIISAVESDLKLKGESNLLIHNEFSGIAAAKLLNYLQNRTSVLNMLKNRHNNLTVLLGNETGEDALDKSGMIITSYKLSNEHSGSIGILGPERMDYERIIPAMLYFRDALSKLLCDSFSNDGDF